MLRRPSRWTTLRTWTSSKHIGDILKNKPLFKKLLPFLLRLLYCVLKLEKGTLFLFLSSSDVRGQSGALGSSVEGGLCLTVHSTG